MRREIKNCSFVVSQLEGAGIFSGYASVFHVIDQQQDVVVPGAFTNCSPQKVKLLWQHDPSEPIGKVLSIAEDEWGLVVKAKLSLEVQRGKDAYNLLQDDAMRGLSIGYTVKNHTMTNDHKIRVLREIDLWEISLVTFPSNPEAVVTSIKSDSANDEQRGLIRDIDKAILILQS